MNFQDWLKAKGYDNEKLTPENRKHLELAWKADTNQLVPVATHAPSANRERSFDVALKEAQTENERIRDIDELFAEQVRAEIGFPERVEALTHMRTAAIDQKWPVSQVQIELLKQSRRTTGPIISIHRGDRDVSADAIEAAVLRGVGYAGLEKKFDDKTLSSVDKNFRRGLSLRDLTMLAAERNSGYRGSSRDISAMCKAAFRERGNDGGLRSEVGPSSIDVTGILSNVANKFLEQAFLFTEQAWREIAKIRPANDYKEMTIYRMTGSAKFEKVNPDGEIKHGTLGELSYGLKADIYGKMLGINEQDFRNDDLGAFTGVADELGRGGGDSLNDLFWTEFLDDSTFFPTNKSKKNYDDGATDSVLSLVGLNNAETIFRLQTKPDGSLLGARPEILLTPATLSNTAMQLMGSGIIVPISTVGGPSQNVFAGRYRTVSSAYLDAASTTAWYLLANPNNIPVIAVCFLDGVQTPTVETGRFDFDRLGIAMRGTMRFGVRKQEYRGGVKLKGAA